MRHKITESGLNEWLRLPQWKIFASSATRNGSKRLEVDATASNLVLRVIAGGNTTFLGTDKTAAVRAYNDAP